MGVFTGTWHWLEANRHEAYQVSRRAYCQRNHVSGLNSLVDEGLRTLGCQGKWAGSEPWTLYCPKESIRSHFGNFFGGSCLGRSLSESRTQGQKNNGQGSSLQGAWPLGEAESRQIERGCVLCVHLQMWLWKMPRAILFLFLNLVIGGLAQDDLGSQCNSCSICNTLTECHLKGLRFWEDLLKISLLFNKTSYLLKTEREEENCLRGKHYVDVSSLGFCKQ